METPFERSGGLRTPDNAETVAWLRELAEETPIFDYQTFGISPRGRELPLVVADLFGRYRPDDHGRRRDRVVVLVQACIHAGESCGKDAGMLLLRDLARSRHLAGELLAKVTVLFIPIFNVDGHARFGPFGRINQNGPEEMGWRTTSRNLNLNRDYLKADTAEMRDWLSLFNAWAPDFFVDVHSTDGADYQYPITYKLETKGNMVAGLAEWTAAFGAGMERAMRDDGYPMAPYVTFKEWHDPRSGLRAEVMTPRFSQGYTAIRNRPGLLIETHMLKDYATRVESTRRLLTHTLRWLNGEAASLRAAVAAADAWTASPEFRAEPFPLSFELTEKARQVEFLGFSYEAVTSEVTGGQYFRYSDIPETMSLDFWDDSAPSVTADLPEAYVVPPEWVEVVERFDAHGIAYRRLAEDRELRVRTWRFSHASWQERPYEGRHPVTFAAESLVETRVFPAGSVVVDMNQSGAPVAAHLLEPLGPDALVGWGFFDAVFSQVEYAESYVIEAMIPRLLAENPAWEAELAELKAADPAFAADPWAIRHWFYARTPYFDDRLAMYPVGCLDDPADLEALPLR